MRFYDLTGGLGVDFSMIAAFFDEAVHVETNATLSELVAHTLPLLGIRHARTICADAETVAVEMAGADLVMLDPARRCG